MRKFSKIALVLLMLVVSAFGLVACKDEISGISVKQEDMPRLEYVEGQELDLSSGELTVTSKKSEETVALNASGVVVSGYDKTKVGEQVLTVEYEGFTTQITVTVKPRMVVENHTSVYFIGEEFNTGKGQLKIEKDDGTSYTVPLNDSAVTISNFSSEQAGAVTVTARYQKDAVDYSCQFTVQVYTAKISLKKPNKLAYKSHETTLDLAGGYLTLSADQKQEYVPLTKEMVTGFDATKATVEHTKNPLKQLLTVSYAGQQFTFEISITYSDVSLVKAYAAELSELDWSQAEAPEISQTQGDTALEAAQLYLNLTAKDKNFITEDERLAVMRTAAKYGYDAWVAAAEVYKDTFKVSNGAIVLVGTSYEQTKADFEKLKNNDDPFFLFGNLLIEIALEVETDVYLGEQTIGEYLEGVYDPLSFDSDAMNVLEYMLTLHETLVYDAEDFPNGVPSDWAVADLENYETRIKMAAGYVANTPYSTLADRYIFGIVSKWREKNDYFDIIYSYYYHTDQVDSLGALKNIQLPGQLEELYLMIINLMLESAQMAQSQEVDNTSYMLNYFNALELSDSIATSPDGMYKDLFYSLKFEGLISSGGQSLSVSFLEILQYAAMLDYGYNDRIGAMLGDELMEGYWKQYLGVMQDYKDNGEEYLQSTEFGPDAAALLEKFVELPPLWQYGFLYSLNTQYRNGVPEIALDYKNHTVYTYFIAFLIRHYESVLPDAAHTLFCDLLVAIEQYSRLYTQEDGVETFLAAMAKVETGYGQLSPADKGVFNTHLEKIYLRYVAISDRYENLESAPSADLSGLAPDGKTWQAKFDELIQNLKNLNRAYGWLTDENMENDVYVAFFAAFENAQALAMEIIEYAPQEVLNAYYYQEFPVFSNLTSTLDYQLFLFRSIYVRYLTGITVTMGTSGYKLWSLYTLEDLAPFMMEANYVIWTGIAISGETETDFAEPQRVVKAMEEFRKLSSFSKSLLMSLDKLDLYSACLTIFFAEKMTTEAASVAKLLIAAEKAYTNYSGSPDGTGADGTPYVDTWNNAMTSLKTAYAIICQAGKEADKASFDAYLADAYAYYVEKYEQSQQS